jgi:hypothetical protein
MPGANARRFNDAFSGAASFFTSREARLTDHARYAGPIRDRRAVVRELMSFYLELTYLSVELISFFFTGAM